MRAVSTSTLCAKEPRGFGRPENLKAHYSLSKTLFIEWPNTTCDFSLPRGVAPYGKLSTLLRPSMVSTTKNMAPRAVNAHQGTNENNRETNRFNNRQQICREKLLTYHEIYSTSYCMQYVGFTVRFRIQRVREFYRAPGLAFSHQYGINGPQAIYRAHDRHLVRTN